MLGSGKTIPRSHGASIDLHSIRFGCLFSLCACLLSNTQAAELPLWEVGVGVGAIHLPYYPGADDNRNIGVPVIFPIYRGDFFKVDDQGIRGELYEDERLQLDFSVDFNFSVDSEEVEARRGMPDLDNLLQIGPSLQYTLHRSANTDWLLNLPARAAFSLSRNQLDGQGFSAFPHLTYYRYFSMRDSTWRLGLSAGALYGTEAFHDFYYQVPPAFANAERPAFNAKAGFGGSRFTATLVSRNDQRFIAWFARYERLDDAVFEDSPLVTTTDAITLGVVYSRFVWRSKEMVKTRR